MRTKNYPVELANVVCRFGENLVLLDMAEEVVIPAFTDIGLQRTYGKTKFFFHDVEIVSLQNDNLRTIAIIGRFVKDTYLASEQRYDSENNLLVQDSNEIQSSPTAIFCLFLENHKLIYISETSHAPNLRSFKLTLASFLSQKHNKFLEERLQRKQNESPDKEQLLREYPYPELEILPLASETSIEGFMGKFNILEKIEISFLRTNNELDFGEFWKDVRDSGNDINSNNTKILYQNKEGLRKDDVAARLINTSNNSKIKLEGKDLQGSTIKGDNENFKVRLHLQSLNSSLTELAGTLHSLFKSLVKENIIRINEPDQQTKDKIALISNHIDHSRSTNE